MLNICKIFGHKWMIKADNSMIVCARCGKKHILSSGYASVKKDKGDK